jgi:hypothetical protein
VGDLAMLAVQCSHLLPAVTAAHASGGRGLVGGSVLPGKQQQCLVRHGLWMEACADAVVCGWAASWAGAAG